MKTLTKTLLATLMATMSAYASAQVMVPDVEAASHSGATSMNSSTNSTYIEASEIPTKTTIKNTPSVAGPNLTTSNDTCMGATSGGISGPGFGLSLGSTWTDKNCLMLKNSRELWNMGMKAAALARMCMDDLNKEALELTGYQCPVKKVAE